MTELSVLPGVVDHHVHLGLVDRERLAQGAVVEVHDLGWDPDQARKFRDDPPCGVDVRVVGPFHTADDGYPTGRSWAPTSAIRTVADPQDAVVAVEDALRHGFAGVKITLHADFPNLPDHVLMSLVEAAHTAGLPTLVHAEGEGMVELAVRSGADVLVHAPWTEQVPDGVLAAGARMTWISTLAIHEPRARDVAIDNIARFRAVGGRVVYGTDMGNGPTPVGVNDEEIRALGRAGLRGEDLLAAVTAGPDRLGAPLPLPSDAEELVTWLATAHRLDPEESS